MSRYNRHRSRDGRDSPATRELNRRLAPNRCHAHENRRGMGMEDNASNTSSSNSDREVDYPAEVSIHSPNPPSSRQRPRRPINERVENRDYQLIQPRRPSRRSTFGRLVRSLTPYDAEDLWSSRPPGQEADPPNGEPRLTRAATKKLEAERKKEEEKKKKRDEKEKRKRQKEQDKKEKKDKKDKEKKGKKRSSSFNILIPARRQSAELVGRRSKSSGTVRETKKAPAHPMTRRSHVPLPLSSESEAGAPLPIGRARKSAESTAQNSVYLHRPESRESIGFHPMRRRSHSQHRGFASSGSAESVAENKKGGKKKKGDDKKEDKKEVKKEAKKMVKKEVQKDVKKDVKKEDKKEDKQEKKVQQHHMKRRSKQQLSLAQTQEEEEAEAEPVQETRAPRKSIRLVKASKAKK